MSQQKYDYQKFLFLFLNGAQCYHNLWSVYSLYNSSFAADFLSLLVKIAISF